MNNKKYFFNYKWPIYTWQIIIFWTLIILLSSYWNIYNIYWTTINNAELQAIVAFDKDVQYRSWNAKHGGVFVNVSDYGIPNPYLEGLVEYNIINQSGDSLTMINPAYMTRQVHESQLSNIGVKGHITSLKPIRPGNKADKWEKIALQAFDKGEKTVSNMAMIGNAKYFRFMKPLMTEKSCLKCHEKQGYKIGDIKNLFNF